MTKSIFNGTNKFNSVEPKPQNIVLPTMGSIMIFDSKDMTDTLPKKIMEMGSVNKIDVNVGNTLSLTNLDFTLSKHFGRNDNPITDAKEKRNPTSYIMKWLSNINTVIQSINVAALLLSLPKSSAINDIVVIVEALTSERDKPENIENTHIQSILKSTAPFLELPPVSTLAPCAINATLYPDAAITWETPELLSAVLKSL